MDRFGIGNMIKGAVNCLIISSRATGRTTELIQSLKTGDRVVFKSSKEALFVKNSAKQLGVEIEALVVSPSNPAVLFSKRKPRGSLILDHTWIENFYIQAIERASRDIDKYQRELSGHGTDHVELKTGKENEARWMEFNT